MSRRLAFSLSTVVILLLGMLTVIWPMPAAASDNTYYVGPLYYVSPWGSDYRGSGTESKPWRTIGYAVSKAAAGDTIKVMDDDNEATDDYNENVVVDKSLTIDRYDNVGANPQVKALDLTSDFGSHVFHIKTDSVTIRGLDIYGVSFPGGGTTGILLDGVQNCVIDSNRCGWDEDHRNQYGIFLHTSSSNTIAGNTCNRHGGIGILLMDSRDNTISGNSCCSPACDGKGICVEQSSYNTICGNVLRDHTGTGIFMDGSSMNIVRNNDISNNEFGITLGWGEYNDSIVGNLMSHNDYGMLIYGGSLRSHDCSIYLNSFIENARGNIRGNFPEEGGGGEIWWSPEQMTYVYNGNTYTGYLGNYYSDYTGEDANGDGIGDSPYVAGEVLASYPLIISFAPEVDLAASRTSGAWPLTVQFTDLSTGGAFEVTSWAWDFDNDGMVDCTTQNPQYTYAEPGVYTVSLTAGSINGVGTVAKTQYITVSGGDLSAVLVCGQVVLGLAGLLVVVVSAVDLRSGLAKR